MGYDVTVVTSKYLWGDDGKIHKSQFADYTNVDGVRIIRLENKSKGKFAKYKDFLKTLCELNPDILFVHGCNFMDLDSVRRYVKNRSVTLYIDNHADETNSATNFFSKIVLHKIIWKHKVQKIIPFVQKFYGVLPKRCEFLNKMYSVPKEKIELLVMGLDDDAMNQQATPLKNITKRIISIGGKIDEYKAEEICCFLKAFSNSNHDGFCVVIYGSIIDKYKDVILGFCQNNCDIHYLGWLNHSDIVNVMKNSSYCVFPGRHSVLWEEAVCLGKPIVVKHIDGYDHVDIGGNVVFLKESTISYYQEVLDKLLTNHFLDTITRFAKNKAKEKFLYSTIARKSIEKTQ